MELLPADYVVLCVALASAVTGLFRGLSGMLAFCSALVLAAFASVVFWHASPAWIPSEWLRVVAVVAVAFVSFGLVRVVVKKSVNRLLSQPSDAIFGFVCGVVTAALLVGVWAHCGVWTEYSAIASEVARHVR